MASPPPPGALVGAGAEAPRDPVAGFDELWTAYAFKQDRQKAKAAYQKLKPDGTLSAQMVEAASGWASAYEDNGTEPKWRMRLHNWISGENWLADPPLAYKAPKVAAIANKRGSKAKAKQPTAADRRKPGSRTAPRKVRAKQPVNAMQKWLGQQVASGVLKVSGIANVFNIEERDVQSILDGRATLSAAKWKRLEGLVSRLAR